MNAGRIEGKIEGRTEVTSKIIELVIKKHQKDIPPKTQQTC